MSKIVLKKINQQAAIELLIQNPELNKTEVAKQLDIAPRTIRSWFADDRFVEMYYKRYMILFNSKLPMVLNSMIREAVEGNVMAGRLVLEHSGKLIKNINVTIDSPFEKFLKAKEIDAIDAEVIEVITEALPERNPENDTPKKRNKKEAKKISYTKNKKQNKAKRYALLQRAKKVGLKPLPAKRPTHSERRKWLEKLSDLEQATKSQTHQQ
jgi:hypothetical protein